MLKKAFTEIWLWAKSWARENKLIHLWQRVHSKINQGLAIMSRSTDISFTSDLSWHFYQWSLVGMVSLTSPAKTSFPLYLRDMRKEKAHSWPLSAASLQLFYNLSLKKEEREKITSPPWHYSVIIPAAVTCKIPHLRSPLRPYLWLKPMCLWPIQHAGLRDPLPFPQKLLSSPPYSTHTCSNSINFAIFWFSLHFKNLQF